MFSLSVLQVFGDYEIWLAAENGMYLRHMQNEWTPTMEHLNMDWKESVQVEVVTYFLGRLTWWPLILVLPQLPQCVVDCYCLVWNDRIG